MAEAQAQTKPPKKKPSKTERERLMERWATLDSQYATWRARHMELVNYGAPDRSAFVGRDQPNIGTRKDHSILDSTAVDCAKKLTSSIETGVFSPAREWARFTTTIGDDVATEYLHDTQTKFFYVMAKSNLYKGLGAIVRDDVDVGTGVLWIEEDPHSIVRGIHFPVGSYRLASNATGRIDTVYRRFEMSTGQMVREFGYDQCSSTVQQEWDDEKYDVWHWVQHSCEPRELRQYGKIDARNKPWSSCWVEVDCLEKDKFLRESGFDEQPFVVARWDYIGQNAYGTDCPGMQAIGDNKQLQDFTNASASAVALILKPPMNVPAGLTKASAVPGARNEMPGNTGSRMEPSIVVPPATVEVIAAEKAELRGRIRQAYLNNILFFLTGEPSQQDVQKTATEIQARKDEGLLQISSAYKIFSDEVLDPLSNRVLAIMQRRGMLDPPPQDLHQVHHDGSVHAEVHVEYINNLAAAQKLLGISAVERLVNSAIGMFQGTEDPSVLDNVDFDAAIHILADTLGVKPMLVRNEDVVKAMRAARQQAQQQQVAAQQAQQSAAALQKVSQVDPDNLDELGQRFGPYAQAQLRA